MNKLHNKPGIKNAGQGLVEFVLVIPLLVLILFGAVDLGRAFQAGISVTNAAREGARYGTIYPDAAQADIEAAVQAEGQNSGVDLSTSTIIRTCTYNGSEVTTLPSGASCESGHPIRVRIEHNFSFIIGSLFSLPDVDLVREAEMYVP